MLLRVVLQTVIGLAVQAAVIFIAADDWAWPQGWTWLGEVTALSVATSVWLMRSDPELLKARMSSPFRKRDQRPKDRAIILVFMVVYVAWFVLIGLDARRFMWTRVPLYGQIAGAILIGAGLVLVWETFRANTFATTQVRVQTERGQTVVDSGPYRYIRHPMYAGMVLWMLGTPLMLSSLWGLAMVPVMGVLLALRTLGEEEVLRKDLAGYLEYTAKTPWRIVPGVW